MTEAELWGYRARAHVSDVPALVDEIERLRALIKAFAYPVVGLCVFCVPDPAEGGELHHRPRCPVPKMLGLER